MFLQHVLLSYFPTSYSMCMQVALYAAYRRGRRIHYLTLRASAHSSIRLPNDQLPSVTFARMKLRQHTHSVVARGSGALVSPVPEWGQSGDRVGAEWGQMVVGWAQRGFR